jgi:hypothetical protein
MDNTEIAGIYNETFSGLALFYRDTTLAEELSSTYKKGQILMERGFTDMTFKGGGLSANLRYLIASSQAKDLSMFNPDAAQSGLVVLGSNAFFKVLDIYKVGKKTQVFLLNIPPAGIDLFATSTSNVEEDIIKVAREKFDSLINEALVPELQTTDWKDRTKAPIGMSDDGNFFHQSKQPPTHQPTDTKQGNKIEPLNNEPDEQKPWWNFW